MLHGCPARAFKNLQGCSRVLIKNEYDSGMGKETLKKGIKISDLQGKRKGQPFAGLKPSKIQPREPISIDFTAAIRELRGRK
jgi:hypothetical protein